MRLFGGPMGRISIHWRPPVSVRRSGMRIARRAAVRCLSRARFADRWLGSIRLSPPSRGVDWDASAEARDGAGASGPRCCTPRPSDDDGRRPRRDRSADTNARSAKKRQPPSQCLPPRGRSSAYGVVPNVRPSLAPSQRKKASDTDNRGTRGSEKSETAWVLLNTISSIASTPLVLERVRGPEVPGPPRDARTLRALRRERHLVVDRVEGILRLLLQRLVVPVPHGTADVRLTGGVRQHLRHGHG